MKKTVIFSTLVLFAIMLSNSFAGVPVTFTPGTVAKSSEVNANFQHVNYGNVVVKDGNGNEIGTLLSIGGEYYPWNLAYIVLTPTGYIVHIAVSSGSLMTSDVLYYSNSNCTGTIMAPIANGHVFALDWSSLIYYIPKTSVTTSACIPYGSSRWDSDCGNSSGCEYFLHEALPNAPLITGSTDHFTPPLIIERR